MERVLRIAALIAGAAMTASIAHAEIKVGFVTSLSGPGASIGIPYGRGIQAAVEHTDNVDDQKIKLIQLDDGSDPSAATRNARKLVEEDKVDLLIGTLDNGHDGGCERAQGPNDRDLARQCFSVRG
jgi:branched-chain amino acid transport system substrate-binding protein